MVPRRTASRVNVAASLNLELVMGTVRGVMIHEALGGMAVLGGLFIIGAAANFTLRAHSA